MLKKKPFDAAKFMEELSAKQTPGGDTPLGEIIGIFLNNQKEIGLRAFALRCNVSRVRLRRIIDGAPMTEDEFDRITQVFTEISQMYAERAQRARYLHSQLQPAATQPV